MATYYIPSLQLLTADGSFANLKNLNCQDRINLSALEVSKELHEEIKKAGKRASVEEIKTLILKLCRNRFLTAQEIADLLNRNMRHLRDVYISPMVSSGKLILLYPDNIKHRLQAYKAKSDN